MFEFEQGEAPPRLPGVAWTPDERLGPQRIRSFSTVSWGEHCTECAFPTCYTTCSFYQPRQDGRCRRFEHGISRVAQPCTWLPYSAYLRFRNWSMLWAQGNATQLPAPLSSLLGGLGGAAWAIANPLDAIVRRLTGRRRLSLALQSLRRRTIKWLGSLYRHFPPPDAFLLEVVNPESAPMRLRVWIRGRRQGEARRFEWGGDAPAGFSSFEIAMSAIAAMIDPAEPFDMGFTVEQEEGKSLFVCSAHFVRFAKRPASEARAAKPKKVKCVVWDLDNTLWDGILVEAAEGSYPPLRDGVRTVLETLDKRGIVSSIASKNSEPDARKALEHHGIAGLFVAPQIHWQPKSQSLRSLAKQLNLGMDSFVLIDDQPFEREEVEANAPGVRTLDAGELIEILGRPEFAGDAHVGGSSRRELYQTDLERQRDFAESGQDYDQFLAACAIKVAMREATASDLPRIQDIVQRTNQLNTSARRYEAAQLERLLTSPEHDCLLVECADRYGSYGQVGFIVAHRAQGRAVITDCMFSCRIQGKRVDEAVLATLINKHWAAGMQTLAVYVANSRNGPAAEMLGRTGFDLAAARDHVCPLRSTPPLRVAPFIEIAVGQATPALP